MTETTSTKTTYFDPILIVNETTAPGWVSLGCKRKYVSEVEISGHIEREHGTQWLVYDAKKLVWKTEAPVSITNINPTPPWLITLPTDVWESMQLFIHSLKGAQI